MRFDVGNGSLWNGDCLELMRYIPDASVDMSVTSPPYDNLRTYNNSLSDWTPAKWQAIIAELYRIAKLGGVVVWNVADATLDGSETGTSFRQALYAMGCGFRLHDTMIWAKDGGGAVGNQLSYTQNFEFMFVWSKGRPSRINLLRDKPNQSAGIKKSSVGRRKAEGDHKLENRAVSAEFSKRNNWWYIPPANQGGIHPAVFPLQLAADHIASWSNPGDLVFDPFSGSGTTAVAAQQAGRRWLCIEKDPAYYLASCGRIHAATTARPDISAVR